MSFKRVNNILNKIIIILVLLTISLYAKKEFIDNNKNEHEIKEEVNNTTFLEIYFFDVGQADSILIKEKDYTMLIDAGNKKDGNNLVNYLSNELKIEDLDILVGTHPHEDHIGGLSDVINNFKIKKLYLPNVTTTTKIFENLLDSIEKNKLKITVPKIGEEIKLGNMNYEVIYTGTDENDLNSSSIVLKLSYFNTAYLFMGDATSEIEEKILKKDIKADVLKVGHHGSNYSTKETFLNKVNPNYAIIQVGKNNLYNHPGKKTINKLKNIKIYRTDVDGTIKLTSDGKNINIETLDTNLDG